MLSLVFAFLRIIPSASAQLNPYLIPQDGTLGAGCSFITGEFHFHCVPLYVAYLIQMVLGLIGTICLLMIIWSGFEFVFVGFKGDTSAAKARLQNAIFGFAFAVLSYLMVDTIVGALLL